MLINISNMLQYYSKYANYYSYFLTTQVFESDKYQKSYKYVNYVVLSNFMRWKKQYIYYIW